MPNGEKLMSLNYVRIARAVAISLLVILTTARPQSLWAQATSSAISGVVHDQSQAVIAGAAVTVTNTET